MLHDDPTRTLAEVLDPQPEASVVIKRLLDLRVKNLIGNSVVGGFLLHVYAFVPVSPGLDKLGG